MASVLSRAQNLPADQNYTYSRSYLEPVTYNASNPNANNSAKQIQSVQYVDGLGRAKQSIAIGATYNGQDMVSTSFYDAITGMQTKQYLPIPMASLQGNLQSVNEADINSYYGVSNAFAEVKTEDSPLLRPTETAAPGDQWQMSSGKTKKTEYLFNGLNEIKKYVATSDINESLFFPLIVQSGNFAPNNLNKIKSTDEDNNVSYIFQNSLGQTLMTRQENRTEKLDTYYLYNQYGQLVMIVPPKASALASLSQTVQDQLCYIYRYDAKGRLIEKKLPGKGKEEMVYDKADRLILYRDAKMNSNDQWLLTKYDKFGRVLYTGFITGSGSSRATQQTIINDLLIVEEPNSSGFTRNNLQIYYSNNYFYEFDTLLSVNYYDEYPSDAPLKPTSILTQNTLSADNLADRSTKTLPTAFYVKNLSDDKWTRIYYWYDERGRSIGATEINHLGGTTTTNTKFTWAGLTEKVETVHQRKAVSAAVTVSERFEYNERNFLTKQYHKADSQAEELLAEYTYNELGQVTNKKVGNNLESIDYAYNVRGWVTSVNNPSNLGTHLFGYQLKYSNPSNTNLAVGKYNGNISEVDWASADTSTLQRYGYLYDSINRLKKANYQRPNASSPELHFFDEEMSYDLNGNISTLKRNAAPIRGLTPVSVDNLAYVYNGNQLDHITDATNNVNGYHGGGSNNTYDINGNLLTMPDKNITGDITYNLLNLPEHIEQNGIPTDYFYRADGKKYKKIITINGEEIKTEYLDGFVYTTQYSGALSDALHRDDAATQDVVAAGSPESFVLADKNILPGDPAPEIDITQPYFFPTSEGFYNYENKEYIYQYKDHLGNVRLSYKRSSTGNPEIIDANSYYAFGLNFIELGAVGDIGSSYSPSTDTSSYKYNGKELQETGMYDYGWRQYMPDLGRWFGMDKLSEDYSSASPYAYVLNNPVMMFDPDGRVSMDWINSFWNNSQNGVNTTWTNTGSGFSNNWGGNMDYDASPTNFSFGGTSTGINNSGSGGNLSTINLPPVYLTGKSSGWGQQIQNQFNSYMDIWNSRGSFNHYSSNRSSQSGWGNTNPWGVAWATSGVLLADDATGVGVVDDVAIVGIVAGALAYDATYRTYVTYTLTNPNGQKYAGRASGFGDPYSIMMNRFSMHHMKLQGYGDPVLDASAQGYPSGYSAIRGREQQLIDYYGGVGSPNVGNSIRGVSKINPYGRVYHSMSNTYFGPLSGFTGW